jgi:hypothetical protein
MSGGTAANKPIPLVPVGAVSRTTLEYRSSLLPDFALSIEHNWLRRLAASGDTRAVCVAPFTREEPVAYAIRVKKCPTASGRHTSQPHAASCGRHKRRRATGSLADAVDQPPHVTRDSRAGRCRSLEPTVPELHSNSADRREKHRNPLSSKRMRQEMGGCSSLEPIPEWSFHGKRG